MMEISSKLLCVWCKDGGKMRKYAFHGTQNRGICVPNSTGRFCPPLLLAMLRLCCVCVRKQMYNTAYSL